MKQIIDWTTKRIWASITEEELYNTQNAFNLLAMTGWEPELLLAIINSRLMTFYHRKRFLDEFKMRFQKILIKDCRRFPIPSSVESSLRENIVALVRRMLELHSDNTAASTPHERTTVLRDIETTDRQLDQLVYDVYGLGDNDIRVVERAVPLQVDDES